MTNKTETVPNTAAASDDKLQKVAPMPVPQQEASPDADVMMMPPVRGECPWAPDAQTIISIARNEAESRGAKEVGSEHLLLAMTKIQGGKGREMLDREVLSIPEMEAHIERNLEGEKTDYDPVEDPTGPLGRLEAAFKETAPMLTVEGLMLVLWMVAEKIKAEGGVPQLDVDPLLAEKA